jgi:hypothetical protein
VGNEKAAKNALSDPLRKTVERMIEQKLVLKELDFSRYPRPSMEEVERANLPPALRRSMR